MGLNKYYLVQRHNGRFVMRPRWYHKWFGLPLHLIDVTHAGSITEAGKYFLSRHPDIIQVDCKELAAERHRAI